MTPKQLYKGAVKEASKLRIHLTQEEKDELNFECLDPDSPELCIYGLATGSCLSFRASELIRLCANHYLSFFTTGNKTAKKHYPSRDPSFFNTYFTMLETCISQHPQYNRHFIDFIKGNIDAMPEWGSLEEGGKEK